jgi:hypothetical protein
MNDDEVLNHELCGQRWSREEDNKMKSYVNNRKLQQIDWNEIAALFNYKRLAIHCKNRYEQVIQKGLVKGPWTKEEDEIILRCKRLVFFYNHQNFKFDVADI